MSWWRGRSMPRGTRSPGRGRCSTCPARPPRWRSCWTAEPMGRRPRRPARVSPGAAWKA